MTFLAIICILIFFIILLIAMAIMQLKAAGINVKDFWSFIDANENLDKMYRFAQKYENMTKQEQVIYLAEAERIFQAFDKMPNAMWEDEYPKYSKILDTYKNIKIMRWTESSTMPLKDKK